jgi:hypothetical protein
VSLPLAGLRVIVTRPPHTWFGGVDYNFSVEMAEELRVLGASVFPLDTAGFILRSRPSIQEAVDALRSFRGDVALSLPNALYVLLCRTIEGQNVLTDVLQVPTIMLWDHGPLQLPKVVLDPLPARPGEATTGAIHRIREALNHPLYHHYSPDRGHIDALDQLGLLTRDRVQFFLQPTYPNFLNYGYRQQPNGAFRTPLAFAGNVYVNASAALPFRDEPTLIDIEQGVMAAKTERLSDALWDLFMARITTLDAPTRQALGLVPDSTFFWRFMHDEIEVLGTTTVRLAVLTALKHEYEFYGNFVEPAAATTLRTRYNIRFRKSLDYFTELPLLFMNSDIIVDVINPGYNTGVPPKVMGCLAAGGFILFDDKEDFRRTMGDVGSQVMYRNAAELNALVDRYLADPRQRRDLSRYLQYTVATQHTFGHLTRRILADEPLWRR